ncbi:MAG: sulfite exporter TauE/SafE family protein [Megasphaera sp.]|jgi:uncharacterized membrane protein YfcA|nr:sulfite exporter TauE/SafE family protein [Megasphaera sp.]MCH4187693.1 sulfite exporter TauE/SafE family protein [Megasphaera sp.]MCH4217592.1 sulfite exporter TauE/SafE family protein [Megasphaera sp.]
MTVAQEGMFLLVLFVANTIQAVTGFAGTLLAMPPSILLIGPDRAKVILNIMAFFSSVFISCCSYRYIDGKELGKILLYMGIGMIGGIYIYTICPLSFLLPFYGIFIIAVGLQKLCFSSDTHLSRYLSYGVLLGAGIMHGMFVSGGALLVFYAAVTFKNKRVFRATLAAVWLILSLFLMAKDYVNGFYDQEVIFLTIASILPLVAATYAGNRIHDKISQSLFMKISYILLILSGVFLFL